MEKLKDIVYVVYLLKKSTLNFQSFDSEMSKCTLLLPIDGVKCLQVLTIEHFLVEIEYARRVDRLSLTATR